MSCSSASDSISLAILPVPSVEAGSDQSGCADSPVSLNGTESGASFTNWTSSGSGTFSDITSVNTDYTPSSDDRNTGTVTLTLTGTGTNNCTAKDSLTITVSPCAGTILPSAEKIFSIYPNPCKGNISIRDKSKAGILVEAFNSTGTLIFKGLLQDGESFFIQKKGIYLIKCTDKNGTINFEKAIVE
jgi:hypothetical protein